MPAEIASLTVRCGRSSPLMAMSAFGRRNDAAHDLHESGFAGTVLANKADDLAFAHGKS